MPTHIVLKIKREKFGKSSEFKARVVSTENLQVQGKDFDNIYAPAADFTFFLLILCICLFMGWESFHVYGNAAFLNGDIDRDVYVYHPFNRTQDMKKQTDFKLLEASYG